MNTTERNPDLDGLEDYTARDDRRPALFFVGRDREIRTVERLCARALRAIRTGERFEGATRLFQGAPGAGKSSLLSELERRWTAGDAPADAPRPLPISWSMLESEEETSRAILQAVEPALEAETHHTRTRNVSARAGMPVPGGEARKGSSIAPAPLNFHQLARALRTASWNRPLCLMVDEIQNVKPEAKNVLNQLHLGEHGLPIVPVFAGLGDSHDRLSGCGGLSRFSLDAIHDIGRLEPEEAGDSVLAMLAAFHVDTTHPRADGWAARLAQESEGWPQHLHNGMRALAEGLVDAGGRLAGVDAGFILRREAEFRRISYRRRVSPEMEEARCLTGAVMRDVTGGAERAAVLGSIDRHSTRTEEGEPRLWRLPESMTARAFLDHLVHRGALQRSPDDLFRCPIPSFRDYLVEQGRGPEPALEDRPPRRSGDLARRSSETGRVEASHWTPCRGEPIFPLKGRH